MPRPHNRTEALARLQTTISSGKAILGAGAGIGLTAKCLEAAGTDLIIIYNSGRFRMAGCGSLAGLLPYGDANAILLSMASEVLPIVAHTPVLAGVCGTDPFRDIPSFLRQLREMGFCGVQNFPTVGLYDGRFRLNLEETGMGFAGEVEMIAEAHRLGLLTAPYVFTPEEAVMMAEAGADIVVIHLGLTTKGKIGATSALRLEECVAVVQEMADAVRAVVREAQDEAIVLVHGGPVADIKDAEFVLNRTTGVKGFFGASSLERLPVEIAVEQTARGFKNIDIKQ
ncbi:TIM-barrel enzyme family protein [Tricharina praecox]|uniref:TIM-barrel enzyme family protein n=1 Tax=Tricharina praecox TaxID=43433 RepID=UPI0022201BB1|nr:TIM-barrel enzyme family protein [Tricharina praecox]KAI5857245.1 TIM-barrel enzyme family protein [Tricharina praecox]